MRTILLSLCMLVVTACSTVGSRLEKFETTARAYERAVRWSDFQRAFMFTGPSEAAPLPDFKRLQNVQVTSYDVVGAPQPNADGMQVVQLVEIRYVNTNSMSERVFADKQVWKFSDSDERWKLTSAFPEFR